MSDNWEKQRARSSAKLLIEIYAPHSPLPEELILFLDALPALTPVEALNWLVTLRGTFAALQQQDPGLCVLAMGLPARKLGLSRRDLEAGLNLHPPAHDLNTRLLDTLRGLADEVRNGTLLLHRIAAAVNADRSEHEALSHRLIASRLRLLGFPFTRSHPTCLIWMPNLVPSLVPSPEAPSARENGSNIQ